MRAILAYILMSQLIFGLGVKSFVVFEWKMNQEEITEKYCINKDKPMMNCNGKCYLSKQLENLELKEEQERKNNPSPEPLIENTNFAWILGHHIPAPIIQSTFEKKSNGLNQPTFWYDRIDHQIDHPPQV